MRGAMLSFGACLYVPVSVHVLSLLYLAEVADRDGCLLCPLSCEALMRAEVQTVS